MSDPSSLCAWSAIDKSVSFMGKRNTLDIQKVKIKRLKKFVFNRYLLRLLTLCQNLSPLNGLQTTIKIHLVVQVSLLIFSSL